jgi:hypothetical protein
MSSSKNTCIKADLAFDTFNDSKHFNSADRLSSEVRVARDAVRRREDSAAVELRI